MHVYILANILLREQAGWWQRNLWGKRNLGQAGVMAARFCQLAPPGLPPLLPNLEGLGLKFIKRDDSSTYMILIKKKHYNPDTGVCKGLDDSHMSGGKVSKPEVQGHPVPFNTEKYQLSPGITEFLIITTK